MATLDKTIKWIDKTGNRSSFNVKKLEGRDKFCKAIQYASRFLMWASLTQNKQLSDKFKGLFSKIEQ